MTQFTATMITLLKYNLKPSLTLIDCGIVGLLAMTGVLHIVLGLGGSTLLLLNGMGYLCLMIALYFPITFFQPYQILITMTLIAYTLITFTGYFVMHIPKYYDVVGLGTKVLEGIVMLLLGLELWQQRDVVSSRRIEQDLSE